VFKTPWGRDPDMDDMEIDYKFKTVTVSRQFGSRGGILAAEVARSMQIPLFERELLSGLAMEMKTSETLIDTYERMGYGTQELMLTPLSDRYSFLKREIIDSQHYIDSLRKVILELVSLGRVIIVGRCGQCILTDQPDTLHLRFVSEIEDRIDWLGEVDEFSGHTRRQLETHIRKRDMARERFVRKHFEEDINDPILYHLIINFSRLDYQTAMDMVLALLALEKGAVRGEKD
jgi:cytidylate kinase